MAIITDSAESSIWVTEFDDGALKKFSSQFFKLEADPEIEIIPIFICSFGGSVYNCLAMRDLIKSSNKKVATIAVGKAMSAGAALLAAGTKGMRFSSPNTTIMIHEVSSGAWGKNSEIQVSAQETERVNELMLMHLSGDAGKSVEIFKKKFIKLKNADWFLTSEEALKLGIIDGIQTPRVIQELATKGLVAFMDITKPKQPAKKAKLVKKKKKATKKR